MKWYLVDKYDNINTSAELPASGGKVYAKAYFLGVKQIEEEKFDELWRVMSMNEYDITYKQAIKENRQFEWWQDEETYLDVDAPITKSRESDE